MRLSFDSRAAVSSSEEGGEDGEDQDGTLGA